MLRWQCITGWRHVRIGRDALNNPFAFHQIRKQLNGEVSTSDTTDFAELFAHYALALQNNYDDISALGRLKQWCGNLKFEFNPVNHHLHDLRRSQTVTELVNKFREIMTEKPL